MTGRDGMMGPGRDTARRDAIDQALVPAYPAMLTTIGQLLGDWGPPPRPRVLNLGANGGRFAFDLRGLLPYAHLHLADQGDTGGPGGLEAARRRFTGDARVSFTTLGPGADPRSDRGMGEGQTAGWVRAVADGQPWDLVLCFLSLHHLDHETKRAVFTAVHQGLAGGGLFIDAEQVLGPTLAAQARYDREWQREALALGADDRAVSQAQAADRQACPATLDDHLAWLRDAGFTDVDCAFKAWRHTVLSGRKG